MQVVLVYLQPFWRNSLLKCVLQPKIVKNSLKPLVVSACYDMQHVCAYLQPFSHYTSQ